MNGAPRVLVLASDPAIYRIRLKPLLDPLVRAGSLAGFAAVDRDLVALDGGRIDGFEVAIAQRNIGSTQHRFLDRNRIPFVYDIDDLVPELPARRHRPDLAASRRLAWCLSHAAAVSTPNRKLADELFRVSGVDFTSRGLLVPNGLVPPAPADCAAPERVSTLLWTSSDLPLIREEAPELSLSIAAAANELGLHTILIGRFPEEIRTAFRNVEHVPWMEFEAYRRFLATQPGAMAVAPLPSLSTDHQAFIDSKSDIKVVDFLGHGIPAIYSDAYPYRHSDLSPLPLVANDPAAWRKAMIEVVHEPQRYAPPDMVEAVHRKRDYVSVAEPLGRLLVAAAGRTRPLPRPAWGGWMRALERRFRAWRRRR